MEEPRVEPISAQGIARGKLLLFGEHSAVYGYPALGLPLDLECSISFRPGPRTVVTYNTRELTPDSVEGGLFSALLDRSRDFLPGCSLPLGDFLISSTVPESGGFGSSAALCASLAQLISGLAPVADVWEFANYLEGVFHGSPSGVDTGLSLISGPAVFFDGPKTAASLPSRRFIADPCLPLVYGALPRIGNTKELVGGIRQKIQARDGQTTTDLESLGSIAQSAISLIEHRGPWSTWPGEVRQFFGDFANRAQGHLASLNLSTPDLDRLFALALAAGFRGGKLSGAGGGGAFFLVPGDWSQNEGRERIRELESQVDSAGIVLAVPLKTLT